MEQREDEAGEEADGEEKVESVVARSVFHGALLRQPYGLRPGAKTSRVAST
jgi:hypothetical protein